MPKITAGGEVWFPSGHKLVLDIRVDPKEYKACIGQKERSGWLKRSYYFVHMNHEGEFKITFVHRPEPLSK